VTPPPESVVAPNVKVRDLPPRSRCRNPTN
jgi:hypothetical protein